MFVGIGMCTHDDHARIEYNAMHILHMYMICRRSSQTVPYLFLGPGLVQIHLYALA